MVLKVNQLRFITEDIIKNQKLLELLKAEVQFNLGNVINVSEGLDNACYQVNDILDVMHARGNLSETTFKTSLLKKLLESNSNEARRLSARLLPQNLVINLRFDSDPVVRAEACKKLSHKLVAEAVGYFPRDYELQNILEEKAAHDDEHLHYHDSKRLGKAAQSLVHPELSDTWYRDKADRFLQEYGTNIEYQWEEILIKRYCASLKATSGVEIDELRLYEALMDLIDEKHEEALLKDERKHVKKLEKIRESVEPIDEVSDALNTLLKSTVSSNIFISKINEVFSVRESELPAAIKKHTSSNAVTRIPMKATIPGKKMTSLVERTLDQYVSKWNDMQSLQGEPIKIFWDIDPTDSRKVCFSAILR